LLKQIKSVILLKVIYYLQSSDMVLIQIYCEYLDDYCSHVQDVISKLAMEVIRACNNTVYFIIISPGRRP